MPPRATWHQLLRVLGTTWTFCMLSFLAMMFPLYPIDMARRHGLQGQPWHTGKRRCPCRQWKRASQVTMVTGVACDVGEHPEHGLNLRTQLRHGEQRASRCSLGVARSPVHIIFPCHHSRHLQHEKHQFKQRFHLWHGGYRHIRMNRILGLLDVPPRQSPLFSRVENVAGEAPVIQGANGGKPGEMSRNV